MTSRRFEHRLKIVIPFEILAFLQQVFEWCKYIWLASPQNDLMFGAVRRAGSIV
jgi:hypothetical protein